MFLIEHFSIDFNNLDQVIAGNNTSDG
jgi:hypothetical protein